MSGLRTLGFCYLVSASAFAMAATLAAHPDLGALLTVQGGNLARGIQDKLLDPAASFARRQDLALFDAPYVSARIDVDMAEPTVRIALAPPAANEAASGTPHVMEAPQFSASVQSMILPDLSPLAAPPLPDMAAPRMPVARAPDVSIAEAKPLKASPVTPDAAARLAQARLQDSLTPEMLKNFELFLYVSKAQSGPVAQRMYVFAKDDDGRLRLAYDWAASTGREKNEVSPIGRRSFTATPRGFYQLDPGRMYRAYHSTSWDQAMPYAMFFNWERQGLQTGLAIHSATGDDIARLGQRASAGCVHLSPENAATLYGLIRANYKGQVPRFAYDRASRTMSNDGAFARDGDGELRMAQGYKVLIEIEDFGGDNVVAALF